MNFEKIEYTYYGFGSKDKDSVRDLYGFL